MAFGRVSWHNEESEGEDSVTTRDMASLDAHLDTLQAHLSLGKPQLVEVERANGDTLTIGLGGALLLDGSGKQLPGNPRGRFTVLNFIPADNDPPYFTSLGEACPSERFAFYFGGDWSEFHGRSSIDLERAREAMREFVTSRGLPDSIQWEKL